MDQSFNVEGICALLLAGFPKGTKGINGRRSGSWMEFVNLFRQ